MNNLIPREKEFGDVWICCCGTVWHGEKRQVLLRRRGHRNGARGELPQASVQGGHEIDLRDTFCLAVALVVGKEECAVLEDRSPNGATKLVPLVRRLGHVEEVPCV